MSLRDLLKQREQARDSRAEGSFPEGVTRYVGMGHGREVNEDGRDLVILGEPNDWYAYFVHEDAEWTGTKSVHKFQKHTCLHNPQEGDDIRDFLTKGTLEQCPTCASMTSGKQRRLYFIIPVYDPEYEDYRVIDTKEFHAVNLIKAYDSIERTARKFQKDYTLVGQVVHFFKDDKTFSMEQADMDPEEEEKAIEGAKDFIGNVELWKESFKRERPELVEIIRDSIPGALDISVVEGEPSTADEEISH